MPGFVHDHLLGLEVMHSAEDVHVSSKVWSGVRSHAMDSSFKSSSKVEIDDGFSR